MRFFTKGLLVIAIPGLFELVLLGVLLKTEHDAELAARWSLHSKTVLNQAAAVLDPMFAQTVRLRDAVLGRQGALLNGSPLAQTLQGVDRLAQLVVDNPAQEMRVRHLRDSVLAYAAWSRRVRADLASDRRAALLQALRDGADQSIIDGFHAELVAFQNEEIRLDQQRSAEVADARRRQAGVLVGAALAAVCGALVAMILVVRGTRGRLATLTRNAELLADGAPLAPALPGTDELALLDIKLREAGRRLSIVARNEAQFRADLEQRSAALESVNEDLRQQTQENEMFIYSVSHDLRSPLVNLQGFSKELALGCEDLRALLRAAVPELGLAPDGARQAIAEIERTIDADIGESLGFLQTAVLDAASIIDALLQLSRAGRAQYRLQKVEMEACVRRVVAAARQGGALHEDRVSVRIDALPPAWGDPDALEQAFTHLLDYALGMLEPTRPGQIEIGSHAQAEGDSAQNLYYVRDNGRGIPAAEASTLFNAFARPARSTGAGAPGVGLALVRRIVERHEGSVWVESTDGVGSTFHVSLCSGAHSA